MTHLILPKTDNFFLQVRLILLKRLLQAKTNTKQTKGIYSKDKILMYKKKETIKNGMDSVDVNPHTQD